jgi:hypothetical protein
MAVKPIAFNKGLHASGRRSDIPPKKKFEADLKFMILSAR